MKTWTLTAAALRRAGACAPKVRELARQLPLPLTLTDDPEINAQRLARRIRTTYGMWTRTLAHYLFGASPSAWRDHELHPNFGGGWSEVFADLGHDGEWQNLGLLAAYAADLVGSMRTRR